MSDYKRLYKDVEGVSKENVELYAKLDMKKIKFILNCVIVIIFIVFILTCLLELSGILPSIQLIYTNSLFWIIPIAAIINHLVSFLLHYFAYRKVKKASNSNKDDLSNKQKKNKIIYLMKKIKLILLTPDYFYASWYKDKLKKEVKNNENKNENKNENEFRDEEGIGLLEWDKIKIERKFFVKYSNWFNVFFIIVVLIIALGIFNYNGNGIILSITFYFLLVRLLSRAIEIIVAYYNDVVNIDFKIFNKGKDEEIYINNWKSSAIRKSSRISLAIYTLFEMVLTFSLLYYFICIENLINDQNYSVINSIYLYFEFFMHSLSVNIFNVSYESDSLLIYKILHVSQVFIGFVLIVLSLARYLGLSDEIIKREKDFYIAVEKEKKNKNNK